MWPCFCEVGRQGEDFDIVPSCAPVSLMKQLSSTIHARPGLPRAQLHIEVLEYKTNDGMHEQVRRS